MSDLLLALTSDCPNIWNKVALAQLLCIALTKHTVLYGWLASVKQLNSVSVWKHTVFSPYSKTANALNMFGCYCIQRLFLFHFFLTAATYIVCMYGWHSLLLAIVCLKKCKKKKENVCHVFPVDVHMIITSNTDALQHFLWLWYKFKTKL